MTKKKKGFILIGMVALLVLTGWLNIVLNSKANANSDSDTTVTANFFDMYRADRLATREQTILTLDSIINNETLSEEQKAEAIAKKVAIAATAELELNLETLIKARGFSDAVVTDTTENINVVVKAAEIDEDQATQIFDLIDTETHRPLETVRIIPVE